MSWLSENVFDPVENFIGSTVGQLPIVKPITQAVQPVLRSVGNVALKVAEVAVKPAEIVIVSPAALIFPAITQKTLGLSNLELSISQAIGIGTAVVGAYVAAPLVIAGIAKTAIKQIAITTKQIASTAGAIGGAMLVNKIFGKDGKPYNPGNETINLTQPDSVSNQKGFFATLWDAIVGLFVSLFAPDSSTVKAA